MNNISASLDRQKIEKIVSNLQKPFIILVVVLALILPLVTANNRYFTLVLTLIGIYIIAVTGLDIVFGYSGQVSLGHAAFYGIGAYSIAILSGLHGWNFWVSFGVGIISAGILAFVIGWPSVKLVHHFLALVTIGVGEIFRLFFLNADQLTQGFQGISDIPRPSILGIDLFNPVIYLYLVLLFTIVSLIIKQNIVSSWWGRLFNAIRTNPLAAETFGSYLISSRTLAFVISAIFAAIAGAFYASLITYVSPDTFTFAQSTLFFTMVLIGGSGTFWGPIIGVILLTIINQYGQLFNIYQGIFYGLMIILIVCFLPRGIVGSLEDIYRDNIKAPIRRMGRGVTIIEEEEVTENNE